MSFASAFFKKLVSFNVFFILIIACLFLIVIYNQHEFKKDSYIREAFYDDVLNYESNPKFHADIVASYLSKRTKWSTSNLGALLFKNIPINTIPLYNSQENRTFVVLIWRYWKWLENRHVHSFNKPRCPGHFRSDCKMISEYFFYLVFENSECAEYLTEKSFYHAYSKGAIPVIMGPTMEDCEMLLPPDSFLHVDEYVDFEENSDPLQKCSVRNCKFTGDNAVISSADAVIVHVQLGVFPNTSLRNPKQRWVFLSDEPPTFSFSISMYQPRVSDLANMFNWSMTYRSDSDVPVPYGRTIPYEKQILNKITDESLASLVPYWNIKRTEVLVSILISNCASSRRMDYLQKLQVHMVVDVYGKCSKDKKTICPGHFRSDCKMISEYFFYLVFENSECAEYLTEKSFYHAYSKGAIPVIMGPTMEDCEMLLPPDSFLHVDEYVDSEELATRMIEISKDRRKLLSFHRWRNDFYVVNEHGYFGTKSHHFCRICEALNYNDRKAKNYDENSLRLYFDPTVSCRY